MTNTGVRAQVISPMATAYDVFPKDILAKILVWYTLPIDNRAGEVVTVAFIFVLANELARTHPRTDLTVKNTGERNA